LEVGLGSRFDSGIGMVKGDGVVGSEGARGKEAM
jgi:hypothetical protein